MATIARFKNTTDAAFFQSMLRNEGIESLVLDSGVTLAMADDVRVEVDDADLEKAREVAKRYESGSMERANLVEATHPAKGFPFLAIWFLVAVAFVVFWDGFVLYALLTEGQSSLVSGWGSTAHLIFTLVGIPFLGSLGISVKIFLVWLAWKVLNKRLSPSR